MVKFLLICSLLACYVLILALAIEKVISKGKWFVHRVSRCENYEQYKYDVDLHKRKVNRTHDGFSMELETEEPFTEDFGFELETCMLMDGGCKPMHKYADDSCCRILAEYGKENLERFFEQIGVEPHCPVPAGHYKLEDFIFDNRELPDDGIIGSYEATVWFTTKEKVKISCFMLYLQFIANEDLPEYDDDDE